MAARRQPLRLAAASGSGLVTSRRISTEAGEEVGAGPGEQLVAGVGPDTERHSSAAPVSSIS